MNGSKKSIVLQGVEAGVSEVTDRGERYICCGKSDNTVRGCAEKYQL